VDHDFSLRAHLKSRFGELLRQLSYSIPLWHDGNSPADPGSVLDERQIKILRLLGMNRTPWEIAVRLFMSVQSVEFAMKVISRKLRVPVARLGDFGAGYNRTATEPLD